MPLVAVVEGQRVVSMTLGTDDWDALRRRSRAGDVLLAGCGSRAYLRTSRGGLQHFAHAPGSSGCGDHEGEGPAHLRAKAAIVEAGIAAGWDAEPEVPGAGFVADVMAWHSDGRRLVFEVQLAAQDATEYRDRTAVRVADGAEVVWFARVPDARRQWGPPNPLLKPDVSMPLLRLIDEDGEFLVDVGKERLPLAEVVWLLLAGRLALRPAVTGAAATTIAMLRHSCWKCGAESTVWDVRETTCVGPCGTEADLHRKTSTMWAQERPEQDHAVMRAVAIRAGALDWPTPATIGPRYTQTTKTTYAAFSCPTCSAVFGDFPLRSAWMEAAYEDDLNDETAVSHGLNRTKHPHWCRDRGDGLCGARVTGHAAATASVRSTAT